MQNKEPRCWMPRLLTFTEAVQLEDMHQVKEDLLFAQHCFGRLSDRPYGVVYAGGLSRLHKNDTEFVDWCIFVAGAVFYRRCFTTGVRAPIRRDELLQVIDSENLARHDYLFSVASLHVAHSVNEMELGCTTLHTAVDGDGAVHRGGLGRQGSGIGPFGVADTAALVDLVSNIIASVVKPRIVSLQASVQKAIDAMSDDELVSLPQGSIPRVDEPRIDRPRNWPKRKRHN